MPYLICERGQPAGTVCRDGETRDRAQHRAARDYIAHDVDDSEGDLIQRYQGPQKYSHCFPAARQVSVSLLSGLAAILSDLAHGEIKKTMITVYFVVRGAVITGRRRCAATEPGPVAAQGANIAHTPVRTSY